MNNSKCTWNLFAPKFKQIQLRVIEVQTKSPGYLEVRQLRLHEAVSVLQNMQVV